MSTRMKPVRAAIRFILLALGLAVVPTWLSSYIERTGHETAAYGNLCGPTTSGPCYEPVLKGGFPAAYLFDRPGVSVEHQLSFGEDIVDLNGWMIDWALYAVVAVAILRAIEHRRGASIKP